MNTLMGIFDANMGETQLGKRKRPAEDEEGERELVDRAADDVLATRRGCRTESAAARVKRELVDVLAVGGVKYRRPLFHWMLDLIEVKITCSEAVSALLEVDEPIESANSSWKREKKKRKREKRGRDLGSYCRALTPKWVFQLRPLLRNSVGDLEIANYIGKINDIKKPGLSGVRCRITGFSWYPTRGHVTVAFRLLGEPGASLKRL
ncbi:hypothetical protein B0H16DRAFT_1477340 [Mycena metata]|uniref:Uncharacterized protein n=1 Tax=Mycena metata TaxID=1033252 RepID=A0AAD7HA29_9AGAR|nr:hypothetical protein B0H16DRAFT_1477340 [Mycena metata]